MINITFAQWCDVAGVTMLSKCIDLTGFSSTNIAINQSDMGIFCFGLCYLIKKEKWKLKNCELKLKLIWHLGDVILCNSVA